MASRMMQNVAFHQTLTFWSLELVFEINDARVIIYYERCKLRYVRWAAASVTISRPAGLHDTRTPPPSPPVIGDSGPPAAHHSGIAETIAMIAAVRLITRPSEAGQSAIYHTRADTCS